MKNVAMLAFGLIALYFLWVILKNNRANIIAFLRYFIGVVILMAFVVFFYAILT